MEPVQILKELLADIDRRERELSGLKARLEKVNEALKPILANNDEIEGLKYAGITTQPAILRLLGHAERALTTSQIRKQLLKGGFKPQGKASNVTTNIYIACQRLVEKQELEQVDLNGKKGFRIRTEKAPVTR